MTAVMEPTPTTPTATAPSPGVRRAWRIAAAVAAVGLLVSGALQTILALAHEEHTETMAFASEGIDTIDLALSSGSVDITAADVDEITVEARISDGLRPTGHDERIEGNRLVLRTTCPVALSSFCEVHYDVQVPVDMSVDADLDDGRLRVVGTVGSVDATNDNGSIALIDVEGEIHVASDNGLLDAEGLVADIVTAETDNGSIDIGFTEAPTYVVAQSDNGSVELRLPDVVGDYRVETETDNGSTDLGVATDPDSDRRISATTDNGAIRVLSTDGGPR